VSKWEIVVNGHVNVRGEPSMASTILGVKWKCDMVHGSAAGGWVKLHGEPGYLKADLSGIVFLKEVAAGYESSGCHRCAATWEGCLEAKCCKEAGMQCYKKDDYWAICKGNCSLGVDPNTDDSWKCETVGYRDWVVSRPPVSKMEGLPSLFCYTFMGHEHTALVKAQVERGAGVFGCDEFAVVAFHEATLGKVLDGGAWGKEKEPVRTITIPAMKVEVSKNKVALNVNLFISIWKAIGRDGRYKTHDWVLKSDPETVILPERLRVHLKKSTFSQAAAYVRNCFLDPDSPALHGSLEIFSGEAVSLFLTDGGQCKEGVEWRELGEDLFMQQCMDFLSVSAIDLNSLLMAGSCGGVDCSDPWAAGFHGFGTPDSWTKCWQKSLAMR